MMDIADGGLRVSIPENVILIDALCGVDDTAVIPITHRILNITYRSRDSWAHDFLQRYSGPESPLFRDQSVDAYTKASILYKRLADPFVTRDEATLNDVRNERIRLAMSLAGRIVIRKALVALNEKEDCHDILAAEDEVPAQQIVTPEDVQKQAVAEELTLARLERCFLLQAMIQDLDHYGD